jgi:hypothetical protein
MGVRSSCSVGCRVATCWATAAGVTVWPKLRARWYFATMRTELSSKTT